MSNQERVDELATLIFKHRDLYYNNESIIPDDEFDTLVDELKELSPEHSAITDIGAPVKSSEWEEADHKIPMGSLDKVNTPEELAEWVRKTFTNSNSIFVIEKLDGGSIELVYDKGILKQAITRGNGKRGQNLVANAVKMGGVKKKLPIPFTGSLRGEIILKKSKLAKHFPDIANARNGANGISKRFDGEGVEHLDIMFYQAIGNQKLDSEMFQLRFIKEELKLNTPNYDALAATSIDTLIDFVVAKWNEYQKSVRESLDWEIDGLIIRLNDLRAQEALGSKHMRPVGAVAFKFPGEEKQTTIINIRAQTGNNGHITPVVDVEPTLLMGARVERASVYNFSNVQEMGLDIGANVMIKRGGDVVPVITKLVKSTGTTFTTPDHCESCFGPVEFKGKHLECINSDTCPAQIEGRIRNWVSGLNILELGNTLISKLVATKLVSNVSELYKLSVEQLETLDRMGTKSAVNVFNSIWSKTEVSLETFLGSLSIHLVQESTIRLLIDAGFDNIDKIMSLKPENLNDIKGIGPAKSKMLIEGLERNKPIIGKLLELGVKIKQKEVKAMSSGKLNGKSFVITGRTEIKRDVLKEMIEKNGGAYKDKVATGVSYLIIADPSSTTVKAKGARNLGVELISEEQFLLMVE